MNTLTLHPLPPLRGTIDLPRSKSISNRALLMNAVAAGAGKGWNISGTAVCDDTEAMQAALAAREIGGQRTVDVGAAGTAMRFATAFYATQPGRTLLTGSERMKQRPIGPLTDALETLGARVTFLERKGCPPLLVEGCVPQGGELTLPADVSSQFISALLMVAPRFAKGLRLHLAGTILSRPYIDMTCALMRRFGAAVEWEGERTIVVAPTLYAPTGCFAVEADWSAASYWFEMAALTPDAEAGLLLKGLQQDSLQGDSRVKDLFEPLGVRAEWQADGLLLQKTAAPGNDPAIYEADLATCPDLAQTVCVACAMLRRPFRLTGLSTLRIKETDRLAALQAELLKLGRSIEIDGDDTLAYDGNAVPVQPENIVIDTYSDHRMAMAFAPCALLQPGLRIAAPEVVGKSYPDFWQHLSAFSNSPLCTF